MKEIETRLELVKDNKVPFIGLRGSPNNSIINTSASTLQVGKQRSQSDAYDDMSLKYR